MKRKAWILVVFIVIGVVSLMSAILKGRGGARCDHDGTRIQPIYEVTFIFEDTTQKGFCSVNCALLDLRNEEKKLKYVTVVDEVSAGKIDASLAFFVQSEVFTIPHVKNDIHVFAKKEDALRHASQFNGKLIPNPFR